MLLLLALGREYLLHLLLDLLLLLSEPLILLLFVRKDPL
jgi:hypothetical protein